MGPMQEMHPDADPLGGLAGDEAPMLNGDGETRARPVTSRRAAQGNGLDASDPSSWGRVSRNAPCPCGSGKKYKHCHGASQQEGDAR